MSDTILGQIASRWPLGWPSHISKPSQKQEWNCWTEPMPELWANKWLLFYTLNFGGGLSYKNWYQGVGIGCSGRLARCLTPSCWYSLPRGQKAELMLTTNLWMSVWKVFVKCMKNIWREWIPTAPLSHMISVSCLILLMTWQTSAALFTELIPRHTSLITKIGLKRRSTCSFVDRPNRLGNSWVWKH